MTADSEIVEEELLVAAVIRIVTKDEEENQNGEGHNGQKVEGDGAATED